MEICLLFDVYMYAKGGNTGSTSVKIGDAVAIMRGEGKTLRRKEKRTRIEQIRAHLGLSDSHRTPAVLQIAMSFFSCY